MSNITYHELSNYNAGKIISRTFELDGLSASDHLSEITEWLEGLTESTGSLCEEWIVCDYEDVPSQLVSEWSIDDSFFELQEAATKSHLSLEVFNAGVELGLALEDIEDKYQGQHKSDEAYAEKLCDDCGLLDSIPENLQRYFDMEAYARDLMFETYKQDGHYFSM